MRLENEFDVPAPAGQAWQLLLDVPRVVPCMPGAELTETVDERTWKTTMSVKLGPVSMSFLTDVERERVDEVTRTVRLRASGREAKGRGLANATIESTVAELDDGRSRVSIVTEMRLSGTVGQFGGPAVKAVASHLTKRFAACLEAELDSSAGGGS
jgi:carbon monoxide dehydrogenase subunit G